MHKSNKTAKFEERTLFLINEYTAHKESIFFACTGLNNS